MVTFLLFVPLGDKRCGLLVPLKALKSKMKCDGNYFFPNELIFCFLLFTEKSTDEPGVPSFSGGSSPGVAQRSFSFLFLFAINCPTRLRGTYRFSIIFVLNVCSGCFYSHLAFLNSLFLCLGEIQVKNGLDTRDGRHRRFNTILCEFRTHEINYQNSLSFYFCLNLLCNSMRANHNKGRAGEIRGTKTRCCARELVTPFASSRD